MLQTFRSFTATIFSGHILGGFFQWMGEHG
jgi:hypothetical protein